MTREEYLSRIGGMVKCHTYALEYLTKTVYVGALSVREAKEKGYPNLLLVSCKRVK